MRLGCGFFCNGVFEDLENCRRGQTAIRTVIPSNFEHAAAFHRAPGVVADDGNCGVGELADVADAGNVARLFVVKAGDLAARAGAACEHGVLHVGQTEIDSVNRSAVDLGIGVDAR